MSTENKVFKMSLDVSDLISNYKKAIQTMQNIGGPNKAITSFEQQLRKLETEFSNLQKIGKEGIAKDPSSVNSYTKAVDKAYKKLITLGDEMNKLGKNSGAFNINAVKNLEKEIKNLTKNAEDLKKTFSQQLTDAGLGKKVANDISTSVKTQDQLIQKLKEEKAIRQENLRLAQERQKLTQKQTVERAQNLAANLINRSSTSAASLSPIAQEQISKTIALQQERYAKAVQMAQQGKNVQIPDQPVKDITDFLQKINARLALAVKDARDADDGIKVFEENWKAIIKEIQQMTGTTSKSGSKTGIVRLNQDELFGDIAAAKNRARAPFQAVEDVMRNAPTSAGLRNALTSVEQINQIISQATNGSSNLNNILNALVNKENEVTNAEKRMVAAAAEDKKNTDELANSTKNLSNAASKQAADQSRAAQTLRETSAEVKQTQGAISRFAHMIGSMFSLYTIFAKVRSEIRKTYEDIKTLDKSFASIAMVTDKSVSDMWGTYEQYAAMASELGQKTNSVIEASALYYQQGLDTNEALELTTHTMKLATLANENYKTATEEMTAAIRGFRMEMDSGSHVTDVYSTLAASAAASVNDIASAISRTASIANSAGSSFENTSAFLTKVIETTQESAENIGTSLKTIIARFTEMKQNISGTDESEFEDLDVNKVETALKTVGVQLRDATGQIRDFDDIIVDLGEKWDDLSRNAQRYVATIAAGSRQQSRFIALLDDFDRTKELMDIAADSTGKADEQFAKYADTMEYKLNQLATEWEKFKTGIIEENLFKNAIDNLTDFVQRLNGIKIENAFDLAGLGTALTTTIVGAIMTVNQMKGLWSNIGTNFTTFKNNMWYSASKNIENKKEENIWRINNKIQEPVIKPHLDLKEIQRQLTESERIYKMYAKEAAQLYSNEYSTALAQYNQLNPTQKMLANASSGISLKTFSDMIPVGTAQERQWSKDLLNELRLIPEYATNSEAAFEKLKQKYQSITQAKILYKNQYDQMIKGTENEKIAIEQLNQQMQNNIQIIDENRREQARYKQETDEAAAAIRREELAAEKAQKKLTNFKTGLSLFSNTLSTAMMYLPGVIMGTTSIGDAAKMAVPQLLMMASSQGINIVATELAAAATAAKTKVDEKATIQLWSLTAAELAASAPLVAYGLAVAGVIAVVGGLYLGVKAIIEAFDEETQSTKRLDKEQKKLEETQKKLQESTSDAKSAEEAYQKVSNLKKEYDEISAIKNKTVEEQEKEKKLIDQIREDFPEVVLSYNEATQEIQVQNDLWESIIEKQKLSAELTGKGYATNAIISGQQELSVLAAQREYDEFNAESSVKNMREQLSGIYKKNIDKNGFFTFNTINEIKNQIDESTLKYLEQYGELKLDEVSAQDFMEILSGNDSEFWNKYQKNFNKKYDEEAKQIQDKTTGLIVNSFQYIGQEIDDTKKRIIAEIIPKTENSQNDLINKYSNFDYFNFVTDASAAAQGRDSLKKYNDLVKNSEIAEAFKALNISEEKWDSGIKGYKAEERVNIIKSAQLYNAVNNYTKETLDLISQLNDEQYQFIETLTSGNVEYTEAQINQQMSELFNGIDEKIIDVVQKIKDDTIKNLDTSQLDKFKINKNQLTLAQQSDLNNALTNFWGKANSNTTEKEQSNFVGLLKNYFGDSQLANVLSSISIDKYNPLDKEDFIKSLRESLKEGLSDTSAVDNFVDGLSKKISSGTFENFFSAQDADAAQLKEYGEKALEITKIYADNAKNLSKLLNSGKDIVAITADDYKSLNKFEEDLIATGIDGADEILRMSEDEKDFIFDVNKANEIRLKYGETALKNLKEQKQLDKDTLAVQQGIVDKYEERLASGDILSEEELEALHNARAEVAAKEEEIKEADKFIDKLEEQDELSKRIADNFNTATGRLAAMASLSGSVSGALSNFQKNKILKQSDISSLQEAFRPFGIDANSFINKNLGLSDPSNLYKTAITELQKSLKSGIIKEPDEIMQAKAVIAELYGAWIDYQIEVQEEADKTAETEKKNTEDREKLLEKIKDAEEKLSKQEKDNAKDREKDLENIKKAEEDIIKAREAYQEQLEAIEEKQKAINDAIEKYNELLYGSANRKGKLDLFYNYEQALSSLTDTMSRAEEKLGMAQEIDSATEALNNYAIAAKNLIATEKAKQVSIQAGLANYANMIENGSASYTNRETGQQIGIRFGDYARKDKATGKYILNQRLLNQAKFNDEYKNLIEENIETYNKYLDEYNKINDEITKKEKEFQEKRKQALKAYSDFEKSIADALKAQYEDEVEDLKDKYDSMKAADDDYLDALEDAINKQRQLREKEEKYENLAEQEKRLSLLQRDTSGSRTLDVNKLRKDVDKTRKQLLDEAVDEVIDGLKKLAKENEETRQVEMELRDAIIQNTNHWNWQAEAIAPTFTDADSYANYMAGYNPDFQEMSWAQQQVQLQEYKDQFAEAIEYSAWNMLDATSESGDAIVDIVDVSTESVMAIVSEKTTAFSEEVIRSYNEISQKVSDDLKNQEDAIDSARDALQDAIEKLDELQEKINEAIEKLAEMQQTFEENEIERQEKIEAQKKEVDDAWENLREKEAELLKDQQKKIEEERKTNLSNVIPNESESPELNPSSVIPDVSPEQKATIPTGGDNGQTATPWSIAAATWKNEHGMNLAKFIRSALNDYSDNIPADMLSRQAVIGYVNGLGLESLKALYSKMSAHPNIAIDNIITNGTPTESDYRNPILKTISKYKQGGLVNYTGPAWVDGTPARPEAFLSAADTKAIGDAVRILSDLSIIRDYDNLGSITNNTVGDTSIEINLNIENLSSDVDIDNMLERVKEEIVSVANPVGINTILKQS